MELRQVLKELTPPVLLRIKRRLARKAVAQESDRQRSLRLSHERLNAGAPSNLLHLRPGISFKMHPDAVLAAKHFCYLSPQMVDEMDCFLSLTKDKKRFLDIGALHGIFSIVFAATHPQGRAIAVDASPLAFAKLLYNIHSNGFANINAIECAVSDCKGALRMHHEREHAVAAGTASDDTNAFTIEKHTADDLCKTNCFTPDVIKIDVEGHEAKVLRGLVGTLSQCRPLVFLEIHPQRLIEEGDSVGTATRCLFDLNYTAQLVSGRTMSPNEIEQLRQDERVVFLP